MYQLEDENVNGIYYAGRELFSTEGELQESRAGAVLTLPAPLAVTYARPTQRVLFDPARDSNPFFSLFESLWMLAGWRDARWLDRFVHDFSSRFAEEGGLQHGAYGFRWRLHFDVEGGGEPHVPDQLDTVVRLLRANPLDRRVVISMWDPVADLGANVRDVPCNLVATPRIVDEALDLTVFCRSGDFIWGTAGANAVHFSFLQEYLAGRIGVRVGKLHHVINNPHVYVALQSKLGEAEPFHGAYPKTHPIGTSWDKWDRDVRSFMEWTLTVDPAEPDARPFPTYPDNPWFEETAQTLFVVHGLWRKGERRTALTIIDEHADEIAPDWQRACKEWMQRRAKRAAAKALVSVNDRQVGGQHYKGEYQHWDFVQRADLGYLEGNITKYVTRARKKGGVEDLRKAQHYLEKLSERPARIPVTGAASTALSNEITAFVKANNLSALEGSCIWQIAFWRNSADLEEARITLAKLIDWLERPTPLTEENHYAERFSGGLT